MDERGRGGGRSTYDGGGGQDEKREMDMPSAFNPQAALRCGLLRGAVVRAAAAGQAVAESGGFDELCLGALLQVCCVSILVVWHLGSSAWLLRFVPLFTLRASAWLLIVFRRLGPVLQRGCLFFCHALSVSQCDGFARCCFAFLLCQVCLVCLTPELFPQKLAQGLGYEHAARRFGFVAAAAARLGHTD